MNNILCWLWGAATVGGWWLLFRKHEEWNENIIAPLIIVNVVGTIFDFVTWLNWLVHHVYIGVTP